jgi:hypothetical protein
MTPPGESRAGVWSEHVLALVEGRANKVVSLRG